MSYKRNAAANRDALFGDVAPKASSSKNKRDTKKLSSKSSGGSSHRPSRAAAAAPAAAPAPTKGYSYKPRATSSSTGRPVLTGEARDAKMKEAEDYRAKAKQCMKRGVFSKPDPTAGSMYYKRAADAYQQCGEVRLELVHRVASADCQRSMGAYATAAAEYTRAAELTLQGDDGQDVERKRNEAREYYLKAAKAFEQMPNEMAKAADQRVQAALALTWGEKSTLLSNEALTAMEEAVEAHVPDPLNRQARHRQTGTSLFLEEGSDQFTPEMMALAKQHIVTRAYAHEPLQKLVSIFCRYGEHSSALYAAGAATALLENEGIATLTLSRAYLTETILLLAMGDPVGAERGFCDVHIQRTSYLNSRECKLAEELFRAISRRDPDALEDARSPSGENRACLANLDESLRVLVGELRVSGAARRQAPTSTSAKAKQAADDALKDLPTGPIEPIKAIPKQQQKVKHDDDSSSSGSELTNKSSYDDEESEEEAQGNVEMNADDLNAEMDDLMNDLGLGDESDEDDDSIDLT